jgi:hypothetical protein
MSVPARTLYDLRQRAIERALVELQKRTKMDLS